MPDYRTAPREYFQAVIENMEKRGFEFMAWVTMNSRRNKYHVSSFKYAQESRLFFRAPHKAFIVMLELTEIFGRRNYTDEAWMEDYRKAYWSGFIDYAYSHRTWIEAEVKRIRDENGFVGYEGFRDLDTLLTDCLNDKIFAWHGGYSSDGNTNSSFESQTKNLLDPEELTESFGEMLELLEPYLYPRFRQLQVTDYAPHYTFPEQEPEFWAKFPLHRLHRAANRIWGSDFTRPK